MHKNINKVWANLDRPGSRYVPRALVGGAPGAWLAYDKLKGEYVAENQIGKINPDEMLPN